MKLNVVDILRRKTFTFIIIKMVEPINMLELFTWSDEILITQDV
jgi:hypothetical protein